jgi:hypothetical protein
MRPYAAAYLSRAVRVLPSMIRNRKANGVPSRRADRV